MSARGIASFVAGFGTGYLNSKQKAYEREREEKKDKDAAEERALRMKGLEREDKKAQRTEDLEADIASIPSKTYKNKTTMTSDELRAMTGGSANPADQNYVSDEATKTYNENNTGAAQVNSNAAYFAKAGVSKGLGDKVAVDDASGETKLAKADEGVERKPWKILEEQAKKRMASGIPEQMQLANAALAMAATQKADAMKTGVQKAMAEPGDRATNLLKFASNWPNEDFEYTDMRLDKSGDPLNPKLYAKVDGKGEEVLLRDYATIKRPKGMTVEDAMVLELQGMIDPNKMFENMRENYKYQREDDRNAITDKRNEVKDKQDADLFVPQLASAKAGAVTAGITAQFAGPKASQDLAQGAASIAASNSTTAKNINDIKEGKNGGKITTADRVKSADIKAATRRLENLSPADKDFIDNGNAGFTGTPTPRQKTLIKDLELSNQADPLEVLREGADLNLERRKAGVPASKGATIPLIKDRKVGVDYVDKNGDTVQWDGKNIRKKL